MVEIASLIVVNLLIAAFIGFLLGYFIGKGSKKRAEEKNENHDRIDPVKSSNVPKNNTVNPIFGKNSSVDNKPLVLSTPKPVGKDNLLKIKGIDEKIQTELNNLGIFHFEQIAKWSSKNCDWVEEFLQLPNHARKFQWIEQAKILNSGRETVYSKKIDDEANV